MTPERDMLASGRAVRCMQTRIFLGAALTFSTTRASSSTPGDVVQPKMHAVSVQTLEGGR